MFSTDIIAQTIKYFKNEYSQNITKEQAVDYLNSLASLFESFLKLKKKEE